MPFQAQTAPPPPHLNVIIYKIAKRGSGGETLLVIAFIFLLNYKMVVV
jgi:hypothetical protein